MKNLFQDLPEEQRAQALSDNCSKIETKYGVQRFFTKEELDGLRENVSDESICISELEDELIVVSAPIKSDIKKKKVALRKQLKLVKQKYEQTEEDAYLFADHNDGVMLYCDKKGLFLTSRRLLPHEKQISIVEMNSNNANQLKQAQ